MRRPCAAVLAVQMEISLRDSVGVETAVGAAGGATLGLLRVVNAAIDHHLGDVNIFRLQLTRHALHQSGQPHLAHGECR